MSAVLKSVGTLCLVVLAVWVAVEEITGENGPRACYELSGSYATFVPCDDVLAEGHAIRQVDDEDDCRPPAGHVRARNGDIYCTEPLPKVGRCTDIDVTAKGEDPDFLFMECDERTARSRIVREVDDGEECPGEFVTFSGDAWCIEPLARSR